MKYYWELQNTQDERFTYLNFAYQPVGLIFASLEALKKLENKRITKESFAVARFAVDYFGSKSEKNEIDLWRYLPFNDLQSKPSLPITAEEEKIIRDCVEQIPAKFYQLYFEDFG